jgi:hypothetical protein
MVNSSISFPAKVCLQAIPFKKYVGKLGYTIGALKELLYCTEDIYDIMIDDQILEN